MRLSAPATVGLTAPRGLHARMHRVLNRRGHVHQSGFRSAECAPFMHDLLKDASLHVRFVCAAVFHSAMTILRVELGQQHG